MPLENECETYIGKTLYALPGEWTNWCRFESGASPNEPGAYMPVPQPFHFQLLEVTRFLDKIRGGIGLIMEEDHPANGNWLVFVIRDGLGTNTHNLTTNPANYDLRIGKTKPVIQIEQDTLPMPQWMQFKDTPYLSGIGYIVETAMSLQDIHEKVKRNVSNS